MRIIVISDTHTQHRKLDLPVGDMIIHAGDVSYNGREHEVIDFLDWFSQLEYQYKIFVAGNHDFYLEHIANKDQGYPKIEEIIPDNVIYLNDSGCHIQGINIWGSPIQPWFYSWAFNRQRGEEIKRHWDLIPKQTDILITHGPAYGVLDQTIYGQSVGCEALSKAIERIEPAYFICGHIHEAYGQQKTGNTVHINASVLDVRYQMKNTPMIIDYTR